MANEIFTKKSLDKVSSPEELNDYIKASNPSVWIILSCVIILLAGVCVWGIFGHLDSTITTVAVCRNGNMTVYIREADIEDISQGMSVSINGKECTISSISSSPQEISMDADSYALHVGGLEQGDWVYTAIVETSADDGVYEAVIMTESISPASFIVN